MMLASWGYAYGPPRVVESGALEYLTHLRKLLDDRMLVLWGVGQRSEVIQGQKVGNGYVRVVRRPLVRVVFGKLAVAAGTRVP